LGNSAALADKAAGKAADEAMDQQDPQMEGVAK